MIVSVWRVEEDGDSLREALGDFVACGEVLHVASVAGAWLWLWLHPFLCGLTTVRKLQRGWDLLYLPRWGLFLRLPVFQAV